MDASRALRPVTPLNCIAGLDGGFVPDSGSVTGDNIGG